MATYAFRLDVNHEQQEATLTVVERLPDTFLDFDEIMDALAEKNVVAGIDITKIENACGRLPNIDTPDEVIMIASGQPPQHGVAGRIEFKVDASGQVLYHGTGTSEEDGRVDYKQATTITTVNEGDLLAELIPPTEGKPGVSLTGKTLPARKGKAVLLRLGEGVEVDAEGRLFVATQKGRPIFSANTLTVSQVYQVSGDVDNTTGNIVFDGHVIVLGNVQDQFSIKAKSLEVHGTVGAASIYCKGPVTLMAGINGRDEGEVITDGIIQAKYVNQSRITTNSNLMVDREIVNSRIWCRGMVTAEKLIGGECIALLGIEASIIGSEIGVATLLEPGANYKIRRLEQAMEALSPKIESILRPIQPFFGDRLRYKSLPDEKKEEFHKGYEKFSALRDKYLTISSERQHLLENSEYSPIKKVLINKVLHPDVLIRTELCMKHFKTQVTGPALMQEDIECSTIRPAASVPSAGLKSFLSGEKTTSSV